MCVLLSALSLFFSSRYSYDRAMVSPHSSVKEAGCENGLVPSVASHLGIWERDMFRALLVYDSGDRRELYWCGERLLHMWIVWDDAIGEREHLKRSLR